MRPWWQDDIAETGRILGTDAAAGLTAEEARARLTRVGPNRLQEGKGRGPFRNAAPVRRKDG